MVNFWWNFAKFAKISQFVPRGQARPGFLCPGRISRTDHIGTVVRENPRKRGFSQARNRMKTRFRRAGKPALKFNASRPFFFFFFWPFGRFYTCKIYQNGRKTAEKRWLCGGLWGLEIMAPVHSFRHFGPKFAWGKFGHYLSSLGQILFGQNLSKIWQNGQNFGLKGVKILAERTARDAAAASQRRTCGVRCEMSRTARKILPPKTTKSHLEVREISKFCKFWISENLQFADTEFREFTFEL